MSLFTLLPLVWKFLPSFLGLAEAIGKLIEQGKLDHEIRQRMAVFHEAAVKTGATHDTQALEDLFNTKVIPPPAPLAAQLVRNPKPPAG